MVRSPPLKCTSTLFSVRPFKIQAITVAQVPVPHAQVSAEPRSHTRMIASVGETTCTNSVFFEENRKKTKAACEKIRKQVLLYCEELSALRKKAAVPLVQAITSSLKELNFLQVSFDMHFERSGQFGSNGFDDAEFLISTNPGQPPAPLGEVASGGELSRIMLAVKAVLADTDQIPTLIFDEIDTGISGRTAACVSEKLSLIGKTHQVLCITHLPQIASMADNHFMIAKTVRNEKTCTTISQLKEEESVQELARLLGGVTITDAVLENARELKMIAQEYRNPRKCMI